jgi:hypothetical protein
LPATKNGKEHIFSAQFKSNAQLQGNNQNPRSILTGIPGLTGGYADMVRFYTVGNDKFFSVYKLYTAPINANVSHLLPALQVQQMVENMVYQS